MYKFYPNPKGGAIIVQEPPILYELKIYHYPNGRNRPVSLYAKCHSISIDSYRRYRNAFKQELSTKYAGSIFRIMK